MNSIAMVMKYWWDGKRESTRLRNVEFCWRELQKLKTYLCEQNINVDCIMYDFSPERMIADAVHIPYPLGEYKRAEKINKILKILDGQNYEYMVIFDADLFIDPLDYEQFANILTTKINPDGVCLFDAAKLGESDTIDIVNQKQKNYKSLSFAYAWSGSKVNGPLKGRTGGFGGLYIAPIKLLLKAGGYDEKFTGWGGEDNELLDRMLHSKSAIVKRKNINSIRTMAPYHLSHLRDYSNSHYSKRNER